MNELNHLRIVIVGLGYVGLPLAVEFGKKYPTLGVDINEQRIQELNAGFDRTKEIEETALKEATKLTFTTALTRQEVEGVQRVYIVTVPTPIDAYKKPDLSPLLGASRAVGKVLQKGDIVIYESTVYPGCTEEDCVPILEKESGLQFNTDFYCGYSPERINPGDKENTLTKILKITSGSTPEIADFVDALYKSIIVAGTYKAPSMKVAEAAKIVENCQRDINIAFVNELAFIFERMSINTKDVLDAAGTKWNFLKFKPGLVGGHCIGVDPYYMIHKSEQVGYYPAVIGAGRRVNESLTRNIVKSVVGNMKGMQTHKILIMGIAYKANFSNGINLKVIEIIELLKEYNTDITIWDPCINVGNNISVLKYNFTSEIPSNIKFDVIILTVSHESFNMESVNLLKSENSYIYDMKNIL